MATSPNSQHVLRRCADCNRPFTFPQQYMGNDFRVICRNRVKCQEVQNLNRKIRQAARKGRAMAGGAA